MHLMLCLSILSILLKTESKERAYVDTVYTKIKACNAFNAMFVDTVNTIEDREQRKGLCQHCQYKQDTLLNTQ